jgi:hypothetical protein
LPASELSDTKGNTTLMLLLVTPRLEVLAARTEDGDAVEADATAPELTVMRKTAPTRAVVWIRNRHPEGPLDGPGALRGLQPFTPSMRFAPPVMPALFARTGPPASTGPTVTEGGGTLPFSPPVSLAAHAIPPGRGPD